jgi:hypothetical protein
MTPFPPIPVNQELLSKLNSATKYPSIETYHKLERGKPLPEVQVPLEGSEVLLTEKVDGTNSRIILFPPGVKTEYLIGSREDLLHAYGDVIYNPAQGIVEAVKGIADRCLKRAWESGAFDHLAVTVLFGEVYGGHVTPAGKFYSKGGSVGFRVFDAIEMELGAFEKLLEGKSREEVARWRDGGGQTFVSEERLQEIAADIEVPLTPRLGGTSPPPVGVKEAHEWLKGVLPESRAILDERGKGKPEGVVVRTRDRSKITKIRFEDYERGER